ncbi:hypothetical protein HC341_07300 [Aquisalimonas sp. 2447]|uniref:hypothetical protein n=1 Tax=Aquisalimonas sp. 2447 TaxID=2740807 RepID=UPI0014327A4E|nr:hypothetical protein [Aquisalimonas sp. 2447]QIT55038.1 hypothetical protein HC341_07300 [Aquisalimonas sp. 2447]
MASGAPFIKAIGSGTGLGKTYWALVFAALRLARAKDRGESLMVIYAAPNRNQIDASNNLDEEQNKTIRLLREVGGIPVVRVVADGELNDPRGPGSLYQLLQDKTGLLGAAERLLNRHGHPKCGVGNNCPVKRLRDVRALQKGIRGRLTAWRAQVDQNGEQEFRDFLERQLKEYGDRQLKQLRRVLLALMDVPLIESELSSKHPEAWSELVQALVPWSAVQRSAPENPAGLVMMTTAKLLTRQQILYRTQEQLYSYRSLPMADLTHGLQQGTGESVTGLQEDTAFLYLIDEADESKARFENELLGDLVDLGPVTQAAGVLHREGGRILSGSKAMVEKLEAALHSGNRAEIEGLLGSVASNEWIQQYLALRHRRQKIYEEMEAFRKKEDFSVPESAFRKSTEDCLTRRYMTVARHDEAIQALGDDGLFTAGTAGFLNGHRVEHLSIAGHIVEQMLIRRAGAERQGDQNLREWYELLLEMIFVLKHLADDKGSFGLIRQPFYDRANEQKDTPPVRRFLNELAKQRFSDLVERRTEFRPDDPVDIDVGFRAPHIAFALIRSYFSDYEADHAYQVVSTVMPYRTTSPEHYLERLISADAHWHLPRDPMEGGQDSRQVTNGAFLISATGAFENADIGAFSARYLRESRFVHYMGMTGEDVADTECSQARRRERRGGYQACVGSFGERLDCSGDHWSLDLGSRTNRYKRKEAEHVMAITRAMSGGLAVDDAAEGARELVGSGLKDSEARTALAFVQTTREIRWALRQQSATLGDEARVEDLAESRLFLLKAARGYENVLLVLYTAELDNVLRRLDDSARDYIKKAIGVPAGRRKALRLDSIQDFLATDLGCKVLIASAYPSAGRGLNLKVNSHLSSEHHCDIDTVALLMSPYYSSVYGDAGSVFDVLKRRPEDRNKRAAARLGQRMTNALRVLGWASLDNEARALRNRDISLNAADIVEGARAYLRRQHLMLLAATIIQAIGRNERTIYPQSQYVLLQAEVFSDLLRAQPLLFDGAGPDLGKAASLNTQAALGYVREQWSRVVEVHRLGSDEYQQRDAEQTRALVAYRRTKQQLLRGLEEVRNGSIDDDEAERLIAQWEAFRHPDWLFDPTRHRKRMLDAGLPEEFVNALWMRAPADGRKCSLTASPSGDGHVVEWDCEAAAESGPPRLYDPPNDELFDFRLPVSLRDPLLAEEGHAEARKKLDGVQLSDRPHRTGPEFWTWPHLRADRQGVWGEFAADLWIAEMADDLVPMESPRPLYELFDRYYTYDDEVVVAVDAKHYGVFSDRKNREKVLEQAQDRTEQVREWARRSGYKDAIAVYLNTRPVDSQDTVEPLTGVHGVVRLSAFHKIDITDPSYEWIEDQAEQVEWKIRPGELGYGLFTDRLLSSQGAARALLGGIREVAG